ncbi:MAG TPA: hypothetical protein VH328_01925 [Burkholderiaceae bacterium]|jgi:hypothetical protein|nr:hypothetical protein [Burkholderiaceae bacterium]
MPSRLTSSLRRVAAMSALALSLPAGALAKQKPAVEPDPAPAMTTPQEAEVPVPDLEMQDADNHHRDVMEAAQTLNKVEMLNLAKKHDRAMALALVEGERAKSEAIRQRDALKLSCIQDRLARMKLTRRLAIDRLTALGRDEIQADDLRLRHEFRGVEMALERINDLRHELTQCVGESLDVAYGAETDHVPTAPATDPGSDPPKIDRPPSASTYQ